MHGLLLEALRHREQELFSYLAILGPALGGFVWLLLKYRGATSAGIFVVGAIGVQLLLLLGALYALTLGYNYRYITLELAKIEHELGIARSMLSGWPRSPEEFERRYRLRFFSQPRSGGIPWCTPPEVIKIFWQAFLVAIVG